MPTSILLLNSTKKKLTFHTYVQRDRRPATLHVAHHDTSANAVAFDPSSTMLLPFFPTVTTVLLRRRDLLLTFENQMSQYI